MVNQILAVIWRIFALILLGFLGIKIYTALHSDIYAILSIVVLIALFYVLFLLEGLQIAGLQLKEHCDEAILRFLETSKLGSDKRVLRIAELYKNSFHSFLSGRQILVIMSVVSIASIISSISYQPTMMDFSLSASLAIVVNSPFTNFLLATLLPAWISQLLPQFIADNRSIGFVTLPGAEWITRLAIRLDKIHASRPAFDLLSWAMRTGTFKLKEKIHVGRKRFYESLSSYIGVSRDKVQIVVCGNTVSERSVYRLRKEKLVTLRHKIRPQIEIAEFDITLSTRDDIITGKPSIVKHYDRGGLFYMLEIALSFDDFEANSYADITVSNRYQYANMEKSGNQNVLFETDIPTRKVAIFLMPENDQQISDVSVDACHYTQRHFYDDDSFAYGVVDQDSDDANNHRIDIDYPLYGIEYRISYHHEIVKASHNVNNEQCKMRLAARSGNEVEGGNVMRFTLSTCELDEFVHLAGDSSRSRPH
ncbi:MAG: hypothetical protein OEZ15_01250 [Gammaproteobacteria bacterium]|nr:hypothetical protein [Gammaproteobacteria bacterium]